MFVKFFMNLSVLPLCGLLAACGGSSTNSSPSEMIEEVDIDRPDLIELANFAQTSTVRDPSTIPITGSTTYRGALGFALANGEAYDGVLDLTAVFSNDSLTGRVTDLRNLEGGAVGGTLTLSNGGIFRTVDVSEFYVFTSELNGVLSDDDDHILIDGVLGGDFLQSSNQLIAGTIAGNVYFNGEQILFVDSVFIANCAGPEDSCDESFYLSPQIIDTEARGVLNVRYSDLVLLTSAVEPATTGMISTNGSASYNGIMNISTRDEPEFIGRFKMDMDLTNSRLTGEVFEVFNEDAHTLDGSLTISGGSIDRSFEIGLFSAEVDGVLTDANRNYTIDGSVSGEFLDDGLTIIGGRSAGQLTIDDDVYEIAGGRWIGERN